MPLELHPDDPFGYNGLGVLNWITNEKEDARKNFLKFQQLMKNHTMAEKLQNEGIEESMYFFLERAKNKAPQYCSNPSQIAMVSQFMGQEEEAKKRERVFPPYQVNQELVELANPDVIVLHCLPAHRGQEITNEVADGPHSMLFPQAHNRLHAQKAILVKLLT